MATDHEDLLTGVWRAIELVGNACERIDEIEPSELEAILYEAESLLFAFASETLDHVARPTRGGRGGSKLREAGQNFLSSNVAVLPGPRASATFLRVWLLLLVFMAVFPMLAIQAWGERGLRTEREAVIQQQVVDNAKQLATEMGVLREGARQLLLAIAQSDNVKFRQPEACGAMLAKLKSHYPSYSVIGATDADGRIFCASEHKVYASVANQPFFARAMAHDGLVVGNYWVDPTDGRKMIHFAEQFDGGDGHLAGPRGHARSCGSCRARTRPPGRCSPSLPPPLRSPREPFVGHVHCRPPTDSPAEVLSLDVVGKYTARPSNGEVSSFDVVVYDAKRINN